MTRRIPITQPNVTATDALPVPGEIVGGKYRVQRTLGMGGMGAVFQVAHCVTHKRFAIKWLLSDKSDSEDAIRRFIREAKVAGRVEHPNVVEVYDICQEGSAFFLVMELLEGESLAARVARGRLNVHEACSIMLGCMEGVAAAHAAGVVHRDLKPANIFLCTARGGGPILPKVLDFGISRLSNLADTADGTTTRSGTVIGTPFYMAPEQMRATTIDERVDVYSLGITLYELLAGVRPYQGTSYPDLIVKIASGTAISLDVLVPGLPRGLSEIVSRAMHSDPDARFPSVDAFMHALRQYVEPAAQSRTSASTGTPRPAVIAGRDSARVGQNRRPWVKLVAGLTGASLLGVGSVVLLSSAPDESAQVPEHSLSPASDPNGLQVEPGGVASTPVGAAGAGVPAAPAVDPGAAAVEQGAAADAPTRVEIPREAASGAGAVATAIEPAPKPRGRARARPAPAARRFRRNRPAPAPESEARLGAARLGAESAQSAQSDTQPGAAGSSSVERSAAVGSRPRDRPALRLEPDGF